MSWEALAWAIKQPLRAPDKLALIMLAYRTNPDTDCADPSVDKMARECGMSRSGMKSAVQRLVESGLVAVENRRGMDGISLPNLYRLAHPFADGGEGPPENRGEGPPENRGRGRQKATKAGVKPEVSSTTAGAKFDLSGWPQAPSEEALAGWITLRKQKRAPITATVIERMADELHKARAKGWTVDQVLKECAHRGWQGFHADWLDAKNEKPQPGRAGAGMNQRANGSGEYARQTGSAIDRVLGNIQSRQQQATAAGFGPGPDSGNDDIDLRPPLDFGPR